jgi:hypothetical protein
LLHTRKISFDRDECTFEIIDTLASKDKRNHIAQLNFHLHPHIDCKLVGHNCTLTHRSGIKVELHFEESGEITLHEGELDPILGWYSESFMKRQPTKVIVKKFDFQKVIALPNKDNWKIPPHVDIAGFDFSWHPNPNDPPYVYEFGTQWQKTGGPRYVVAGATETK